MVAGRRGVEQVGTQKITQGPTGVPQDTKRRRKGGGIREAMGPNRASIRKLYPNENQKAGGIKKKPGQAATVSQCPEQTTSSCQGQKDTILTRKVNGSKPKKFNNLVNAVRQRAK